MRPLWKHVVIFTHVWQLCNNDACCVLCAQAEFWKQFTECDSSQSQ